MLTLETLQAQVTEFEVGDDLNTEHYRYYTFKKYLERQSSLTNNNIIMLFDIIKTEIDSYAAVSMGIDVLKLKHLNDAQFQLAANNLKDAFGEDMQKYINKETERRQTRCQR